MNKMNVYVWENLTIGDEGVNISGCVVAFAVSLNRARDLVRSRFPLSASDLLDPPDHVRPCDDAKGELVFGSGGGPY
jgi:hypothetical protein